MPENTTSLRPSVNRLRERPNAEVLVIGAGINGIATFRDLALQGVDVAIVDRGDFVSGASAASSHMVHGGIRYLENGELRLVKESVQERNYLLRAAPHYVRPLRTTIPIYSTFSGILSAPIRLLITHGRGKPKERGAVLIKIGLTLYDLFSRGGRRVPKHRFVGRKKSLAELPDLNPDVRYTATYYDASMRNPERLALDVLHDGIEAGETAGGSTTARAANYVSAVGWSNDTKTVQLRDEASGEVFDFSAKVVVNASGPWTDLTNSALGEPTKYMGGTKGSHVVLDHPELLQATGGRELFFEHSDGRIVLIYPLGERVLVGTTDIPADPATPVICTDAEVDYFFDLIGDVFPNISVTEDHVVYSFSGIRPLPRHDDTAPGLVSRDYRIVRSDALGIPTLSLVGGKWTTFRALAEHLSRDTLAALGRSRKVNTRGLPIGGGHAFPTVESARKRWIRKHSVSRDASRVEALLDRYGTRAEEVLDATPAHAAELAELPGYTAAELEHLAATEHVVHLDDLLLRRTLLGFVGSLTESRVRAAADAIASTMGWDAVRIDEEVERFATLMRDSHRIDIRTGGAFLGRAAQPTTQVAAQ